MNNHSKVASPNINFCFLAEFTSGQKFLEVPSQILHAEPPDLIFQSSKCGVKSMVLLSDTVGEATVELDMGYIESYP